jgi:hypothetical protein
MARDAVRASVTGFLTLALEVVVGIWLLFLFGLALAWDPLDRRFGFHDRRRMAADGEDDDDARADARSAGSYGYGRTRDDYRDEA